MKGDISTRTSNKKYRTGHDGINWNGEGVPAKVPEKNTDNEMKYYVSELDFSGQEKKK